MTLVVGAQRGRVSGGDASGEAGRGLEGAGGGKRAAGHGAQRARADAAQQAGEAQGGGLSLESSGGL